MAKAYSEADIQTIAACPLFAEIPEANLPEMLSWLGAREQAFKKGELIFLIGDVVKRAGVVLEGSIAASFLDESYSNVGLTYFGPSEMFGEALACLDGSHSIIEMRAVADCRLLFLDIGGVIKARSFDTPNKLQLISNLISNFAQKSLFLNQKLRILSQRKLRDRVKVFLRTQKSEPDGSVRLPFGRSEMAEFLGVNRSALSRELSAMQKEGIIELSGRLVRVIDRSFLQS